jgi:hypothetical protein
MAIVSSHAKMPIEFLSCTLIKSSSGVFSRNTAKQRSEGLPFWTEVVVVVLGGNVAVF